MTPISISTIAVLALTAVGATAAHASGGTTYYVSTTGSDSNAGTSVSPFLHIQKCATVMVAGDTCQIASGTYRETVAAANSGTATSRITYAAAPSAAVTIDSSDPVTGWSAVTGSDLTALEAGDSFLAGSGFASAVSGGHIYQSTVTLNVSLPGNQIFVDGGSMVEAQWPYPGNDPLVPNRCARQHQQSARCTRRSATRRQHHQTARMRTCVQRTTRSTPPRQRWTMRTMI